MLTVARVGAGMLRVAAACALGTVVAAQAPSSQELLAELAASLSAAVPPSQPVALTPDGDGETRDQVATLATMLRSRGVPVAGPIEGVTTVRVSCGHNLRERLCVAEFVRDGERRTVSASRPLTADAVRAVPALGLQLRPLIAQRDPILDVATVPDGFLVLQPSGVSLQPVATGSDPTPARNAASRGQTPLQTIPARHWPRDLRGRLRTSGDGFEAFLPGVVCRGRMKPLTLTCGEETAAWPIPIENSGIAPSRNYFTTPEGLAFYGAASIGDAARPRWVVVDRGGALTVLDERRAARSRAGTADDVVRLESPCGGGTFVAAASAADDLTLLRVAADTVDVVARLPIGGAITALWPGADPAMATLVIRTADATRYEAFHLSVSCAR